MWPPPRGGWGCPRGARRRGPSSMTLRMPSLGWTDSRCWKKRHGVGNRPWGKTSSRVMARHRSAKRVDARRGGLAAVPGGVDGPDRGAVDGVGGDAPGHEGLEHADLGRPPGPATGEDEGGADPAPQHPGPAVAGEPPRGVAGAGQPPGRARSHEDPAGEDRARGRSRVASFGVEPGATAVLGVACAGVAPDWVRGRAAPTAAPAGRGRDGHGAAPSGPPPRPGRGSQPRRRRRRRRRRRSCRGLRRVPGGDPGTPPCR